MPQPDQTAPTAEPADNIREADRNQLVASYLAVRRAVGLLGFALPAMLLAFAATGPVAFMPSISEFYYTPVREALVATIGAIAVFLFSYKGYRPEAARIQRHPREARLTDRRLSFAAAAGALGVAVFPTRSEIALAPEPLMLDWLGAGLSASLHNLSALLFFLALTVFCLDNFQRTRLTGTIAARRVAENRIYRTCGLVLAASTAALVAIAAVHTFGPDGLSAALTRARAVFWAETVGLLAFSISWLVKGKALAGMVEGVRRVTGATDRAAE
ncbi:hypothetical protein [Roseovarius salinarum]|uniref:hypothetical protein n=1 Tax=Roseovarius salinarum TaxID=1981892 RepID=UPI000C338DCE|nr:hypothetical protein [Roseovarius salinarum]